MTLLLLPPDGGQPRHPTIRRHGPIIARRPRASPRRCQRQATGTLPAVIRLDAATVLLQWAVGGMAFCWFTTRRRQAGLGYGWLLREHLPRDGARRVRGRPCLRCRAGARGARRWGSRRAAWSASPCRSPGDGPASRGQRLEHDRRTARVAAMTGIDRAGSRPAPGSVVAAREFPPALDLVPVAVGDDRARRRRHRRRRQRLAWLSCARWPAPPSWGRSPTPCCSGTGTSCSRGCRVGCCTSWSMRSAGCGHRGRRPAAAHRHGQRVDRRRRRRLGRHARVVLGGLRDRPPWSSSW